MFPFLERLILLILLYASVSCYATVNRGPGIPPGDTPFRLCNTSSKDDVFQVESIELWPRPIILDDMFYVNAYGTFLKDVPMNSTFSVHSEIIGYKPGKTWTFDFCDPIISLDQPDMARKLERPPEKGRALMVFEGYTPWIDIPAGEWYWRFEAKTPGGETIFCAEMEYCLERRDDDPSNQGLCPPEKDRDRSRPLHNSFQKILAA